AVRRVLPPSPTGRSSAPLKACPSVHILATGREALGVPGEQAWLVPPLSLPAGISAAEVLSSEAGRLFLERARAVRPAFSLDDARDRKSTRLNSRHDQDSH